MSVLPETAGMNEQLFGHFSQLIKEETGIHLPAAKCALLVSRLGRRLRSLGIGSYSDYWLRVRGDAAERIELIDAICTNETRFFREPRQFDYLRDTVIPAWKRDAAAGRRGRDVEVWSAGCSTGEEPYSLAMLLLHHLPAAEGWTVRVTGTDLSTRALENARAGTWPIVRASDIPHHLLRQFMLRGVRGEAGRMKAGETVRAAIAFARLNLTAQCYPFDRPFDLIFCRNVLIYFEAPLRQAILHRLLRHLSPGHHLFLGHAETLNGLVTGPRAVMPNVYVK